MIKSAKYQRGISSLGWLTIILVIGFFTIVLFKLIPVYADNYYIVAGLKSLNELESPEGGFEGVSNSDIQRHMSNFFTVNNVRGDVTKALEIERLKNKFIVKMNYEKRVAVFDNPILKKLDVVVTFNNEFDSTRPLDCCKSTSE